MARPTWMTHTPIQEHTRGYIYYMYVYMYSVYIFYRQFITRGTLDTTPSYRKHTHPVIIFLKVESYHRGVLSVVLYGLGIPSELWYVHMNVRTAVRSYNMYTRIYVRRMYLLLRVFIYLFYFTPIFIFAPFSLPPTECVFFTLNPSTSSTAPRVRADSSS